MFKYQSLNKICSFNKFPQASSVIYSEICEKRKPFLRIALSLVFRKNHYLENRFQTIKSLLIRFSTRILSLKAIKPSNKLRLERSYKFTQQHCYENIK